ncbi:methyltransferase [soil metagenome]
MLQPQQWYVPQRDALRMLLATHAPLSPDPLCPELLVHRARSLVGVWEAAEALAGMTLPAPFWAYPWAGGSALARVLLDSPELVRGRSVLDFGAGGGIASVAAAWAGAASVVANDIDPWALTVTGLAAERRDLRIETMSDDICESPSLVDDFDVVLCSDLAYERSEAPRQRRVLDRAAANGATVIVADAGRTYFDAGGMQQLGEFQVDVPTDLEGVGSRTARVYLLET